METRNSQKTASHYTQGKVRYFAKASSDLLCQCPFVRKSESEGDCKRYLRLLEICFIPCSLVERGAIFIVRYQTSELLVHLVLLFAIHTRMNCAIVKLNLVV